MTCFVEFTKVSLAMMGLVGSRGYGRGDHSSLSVMSEVRTFVGVVGHVLVTIFLREGKLLGLGKSLEFIG